ncbi:flagellar hook assembly protein FlgD [Tabrizicola sp. WMC-M-20]|nr:flagellar hook assembly protein FlgD [Tabrizicola sp. WMC-M-20]
MTINLLSATGSLATPGRANADLAQNSMDYQSFLTLLVAQVANQDPLEPMDSTQFVSQLAQLSQVEQSVLTNANLESIAARLGMAAVMSDVALIGREVMLATDRVELAGGMARLGYVLAEDATAVSMILRDADGAVVRRIDGLTAVGRTQTFVDWDGLHNTGYPLADGSYTMEIVAKSAEGTAVAYDSFAGSRVDSVSFGPQGAVLHLTNGQTLLSDLIMSVR